MSALRHTRVALIVAGAMVAIGPNPVLGQSSSPGSGSPSTGGVSPGSGIGTPAPRVGPVAPLSPPPVAAPGSPSRTPQATTPPDSSSDGTTAPLATPPTDTTPPPGGGGSSRTDRNALPGTLPSTANPSGGGQAAPSQPGGGGKSLADCMGFWDRGTHMTKQQWRAACQRTLNRLDNLKVEMDNTGMTNGTGKRKNDTKKVERNGRPPTQTR